LGRKRTVNRRRRVTITGIKIEIVEVTAIRTEEEIEIETVRVNNDLPETIQEQEEGT
jgi:hypothetical protein